MPSLAEFQSMMAKALLGDEDAGRRLIGDGFPAVALDVYRGNVAAAALAALRLTFPTVEALVGEAFMAQLCRRRLQASPPVSACLDDYANGFARYLETSDDCATLPYLADVARFDEALWRVANADRSAPGHRICLGADNVLCLDPTLRVLRLDYPADEIRAALEHDEEALGLIDMTPGPRWRAIWRGASGVMLREASESVWSLFEVLEADRRAPGPTSGRAIDPEILHSPFATFIPASRNFG